MKHGIFSYLKRINLSDTAEVNGLFISAFLREKGWDCRDRYINDILKLFSGDTTVVDNFIGILKKSGFGFSLEELIELFEFVISPSDRIVTGAVYTPPDIRKTIIERCLGKYSADQLRNVRVADISCGCGGFLMDAAVYINSHTGKSFHEIYRDNLFGIDIQDYSIVRTGIILRLLAYSHGEDSEFQLNLLCADTLDFHTEGWRGDYTGFDVIVGNPPYVCSRNATQEARQKMSKYSVCVSGHPDLYIPFFQIAVEMLADDGILGYITMNSFFRSVNGRAVRNFFSGHGYDIYIIDFRGYQMFSSKNTYTCLFFLDKSVKNNTVHYMLNESGDVSRRQVFDDISFDRLDDFRGWVLNNNEKAVRFESVGIPIGKYCMSRHGIATLSNDSYIFTPAEEDETYYYLEQDDKIYGIEKGICRNIVNSNRLNSSVDLKTVMEKVIFPYRMISDDKAEIMVESQIREKYPAAYGYLKSRRSVLEKRDKGKGKYYPVWYQYGRTQSLVMPRYKLFFPRIADKPLNCILYDDKNLMLYNGMAFVSDDVQKLLVLQKIIESRIFWEYIRLNSKPYSSGYYAISGVNIKDFCVPSLNEAEMSLLGSLDDKNSIEDFLLPYYR